MLSLIVAASCCTALSVSAAPADKGESQEYLPGSLLQISGEQMLVTMKNGYIRDIDGGVSPEVPLTMNRMFDRDYLVNIVNEQFG